MWSSDKDAQQPQRLLWTFSAPVPGELATGSQQHRGPCRCFQREKQVEHYQAPEFVSFFWYSQIHHTSAIINWPCYAINSRRSGFISLPGVEKAQIPDVVFVVQLCERDTGHSSVKINHFSFVFSVLDTLLLLHMQISALTVTFHFSLYSLGLTHSPLLLPLTLRMSFKLSTHLPLHLFLYWLGPDKTVTVLSTSWNVVACYCLLSGPKKKKKKEQNTFVPPSVPSVTWISLER